MKKIILAALAAAWSLSACGFAQAPGSNRAVADFESCVAAGYPVAESYPRQCFMPDGRGFTEDIGPADNGADQSAGDLIRVSYPAAGEAVASPLAVAGQARGSWFFEASFPVELYDNAGTLLASAPAQAQDEWMTEEFVPFSAELVFDPRGADEGWLVLKKDNPSGLAELDDELRLAVRFAAGAESAFLIYLTGPETGQAPDFDCGQVAPRERLVPRTVAVGRAALLALLEGPDSEERAAGYGTAISPGVRLNRLAIEDGVAWADFSEELGAQVGGSCRVGSIRAQIEETLKQFDSVDSVVISINGRSEDILQP